MMVISSPGGPSSQALPAPTQREEDMPTPDASRYVTEAELCELFGVSRNTMGKLRRTGKVTGWLKLGHRYAYLREDIPRIEQVFTSQWTPA